jgi:hypothetical protein
MEATLTIVCAALAIASISMSANAATTKNDPAMLARGTSCKTEAKQRFSALHPVKRRTFAINCMRRD